MNWKSRKERKLRNFLFFLPFQLSAFEVSFPTSLIHQAGEILRSLIHPVG